ncbi:MAG: CxxxxCH/CxxCH domain c-type cytochrome, partial [Myxococcaceae bacterium]
ALYGGLATAANLTNPTGYAFGCGHCHPLNPASHMSGGRANIELYNPAAPAGSLKKLNPASALYTPGPTVFTDSFGVQYTQGTCANVYCHSRPSYASSAVQEPGVDFPFTGYPTADAGFTLTRGRTYATVTWGGAATTCTSCHGLPVRTSAPGVQAMVGQSHSWLDAAGEESGHSWNHGYTPLSCRTCHIQTVSAANATSRTGRVSVYGAVPVTGFGRHVNGLPNVAFDTTNPLPYPTPRSLTSASYNQATATCTNVACHLDQTSVKHGTPYRYPVSIECDSCHQK